MAWVVVFPCGHRNDSVGVLLNHLRNAAPSALSKMDHQRILAPWPLVMCKRCRWTPGMSFHPASWTTPAMSSTFNKQHCRTRRRSSLCHPPWHVRTHIPFHPSLSSKPTLAPHQHIPAFDPEPLYVARKSLTSSCAQDCAQSGAPDVVVARIGCPRGDDGYTRCCRGGHDVLVFAAVVECVRASSLLGS